MPRAKLATLLVCALIGCSGSSTDEPFAVDDASPDTTSIDDATADADASAPEDAAFDAAEDTHVEDAVVDSAVDDSAADADGATEEDSTTPDADEPDGADTAVADTSEDADAAEDAAEDADAASDTADASDDADAADPADASDAADAADPASALPGAACTGTLTDDALVNLYAGKPVTGTPSFLVGGSSQARTLGSYTSTLWSRKCASTTGCTEWASATQPTYESFFSINTTIRNGTVYLWPYDGDHRIGIVSATVGSDCKGWTQGFGNLVRSGSNATVKLATKVDDNCGAGADPVFYFEQKDLYDPEGIVTEHCMKLVYRKELNRIDVGPGAWTYDEYMVVYDATF